MAMHKHFEHWYRQQIQQCQEMKREHPNHIDELNSLQDYWQRLLDKHLATAA